MITKKVWGERGSNSRPQDHSLSYETYALANCATTPIVKRFHFNFFVGKFGIHYPIKEHILIRIPLIIILSSKTVNNS